jgi:hypothetical protein
MASSGPKALSCGARAGSLRLRGCSTGSFQERANSFTGDGETRCPRPRGRSGWVITASTSSPWEIKASREGRANRGVPMKINRQGPCFTWPPPVS